jgi:hypothetical protein
MIGQWDQTITQKRRVEAKYVCLFKDQHHSAANCRHLVSEKKGFVGWFNSILASEHTKIVSKKALFVSKHTVFVYEHLVFVSEHIEFVSKFHTLLLNKLTLFANMRSFLASKCNLLQRSLLDQQTKCRNCVEKPFFFKRNKNFQLVQNGSSKRELKEFEVRPAILRFVWCTFGHYGKTTEDRVGGRTVSCDRSRE